MLSAAVGCWLPEVRLDTESGQLCPGEQDLRLESPLTLTLCGQQTLSENLVGDKLAGACTVLSPLPSIAVQTVQPVVSPALETDSRGRSRPIILSLETALDHWGHSACFLLHLPTYAPTLAQGCGTCVTCPSFPHRHLHNNHIQHLGTHSFEGLRNLETL